jgi:radical SAM protein with 4Fe4S-binding SPASM domain
MNFTSSWNNWDVFIMFYDFLNKVSSLSIRKALNIVLVQLSYHLSLVLRKPLVWGKPFFVSLEPSAICNLACPQCPTGKGEVKRELNFLDNNTFTSVVDEIAGTTAILSLYHQGEPLLHKSFADMVKYATDRKIYTVTSTNGQFLTAEVCSSLVEAGLDRIIISLDGIDQKSYNKYRLGGDFEKVISGIRLLSMARQVNRKPYIIIQFLVFKHNQDQVAEIRKLGRRLGADRVMVKSAQIEYPESINDWMPVQKKYRRYRRNRHGDWIPGGKMKNHCRRLWHTTVITTDGLVVPCCFDKLAKYPFGTIGKETFSQIWRNRKYNDFRSKILGNRKTIGICTNCTEGIGRIYR